MSGLLLIGGGGHCHSVIDLLESAKIPIAGIVHGSACDFESVLGYPALGRDEDLPLLRETYHQALITLGQIKTPTIRQRLFDQIQQLNFELPTIISPFAHVSNHAKIGQGSVVMHQALVNSNAKVGNNTILNTGCIIEHDCQIGHHCHISIGAIIAGGVTIGDGCFIGAGSILREGITIGDNSVIGMGCKILKSLSDKTYKIN